MNIAKVTIVAAALVLLGAVSAMADDCLDCHADKTPGIVGYWQESAHASHDVTCTDCHGTDVEKNHSLAARVTADKCGSCHAQALSEHRKSKHSISMKSGGGCTRNMPPSPDLDKTCTLCHKPDTTEPVVNVECAMFLAQSHEMKRVGCSSCHKVEAGCDSCHTKHGTDLGHARRAETCGQCHMGPDHAQLEMWRSSQHGILFAERGEPGAPTCVTCHMVKGSHNVSRGIATGKTGESASTERDFMVGICSRCHTSKFSKRSLSDADDIQKQSLAILKEGQGIVEALYKEDLLEPAPGDRPGHPIFGNTFVIGPHMTYENISRAEAIYFRMMMFNYMSAFKGAFHQSPDYAHWFGNAPLKLGLSELKSEAALLRKTERLRQRLDNLPKGEAESGPAGELKEELRALKDSYLKGEMTQEEYDSKKSALMEKWGL